MTASLHRPPCNQVTAEGRPCRNPAMVGSEYCTVHGGVSGRRFQTKLDQELADKLVAMLRAGAYLPVALRAVGVAPRTYREWMQRGRSGDPDDEACAELRERVRKAQAEAEVVLVNEITKASRENWQAAAWLLERIAPVRYGKPSVRLRTDAPPTEKPEEAPEDDPFTEFDELAERRGRRSA